MSTTDLKSPHSDLIRVFFDSIAVRYDFLNRLLSFQLDDQWRKRAHDLILDGREQTLLDLGTGTGKFVQLFCETKKWEYAVGLDFSLNMLKKASQDLGAMASWVSADFHHLPFKSSCFDLVISSFTLRSVQQLESFFEEVHRVLNPFGKAAFLCLTRPTHPFWRMLAWPYLKYYLPLVGGALTGNRKAYQFLAESVLSFQPPEKTAEMLKASGFQSVEIHPFSLGLATLILARKAK